MPKRTLNFSIYADTGASGTGTAWGPANSSPPFPSGYTLGGDPPRINAGRFTKFSGSGNTAILDDTVLTGNIIAVEAVLGTVGSDSQCLLLCNPSGTGYQFLVNSTNIRCFSMTNFVLGTQVGSPIAFTATTGHTARVARNNTSGDMVVSTGVDASSLVVRGTINQANVNTDWRAGVATRNAAGIASLVSDYTAAQSIDTLTSPLVMGGAYSITTTGFSNGSATLSFSGVSSTHTLASGAGSGTLPGFSDTLLCPFLPATNVTVTETQGGNTATIAREVSLPANFQVLRDASNNPTNFTGLVTGDYTYLAQWFIDAGNPLTTNDRAYWDASSGLIIDPDGRPRLPAASAPLTTTLWIHRGADSRVYSHTVTVNEDGLVSASVLPTAYRITAKFPSAIFPTAVLR